MTVYTYSEAKRNLNTLLNKAKKEGKVIIKRKDGTIFEIKALSEKKSPLDVEGINLDLNAEEIIDFVEESRKINKNEK